MFCSHCADQLLKTDLSIKKRLESGSTPHYYLFEWNDDSDLAAKSILYFLKHKPSHHFMELIESVPRAFPFKGVKAVVPPSSSKGRHNHAKSLSEALMKQKAVSSVFEVEVKEGALNSPQKLKSKEQRMSSNVLDLNKVSSIKNWVFVDDVFVSGGTFKSISESIFTKPEAIFTLFYKPRLKNKGFYGS